MPCPVAMSDEACTVTGKSFGRYTITSPDAVCNDDAAKAPALAYKLRRDAAGSRLDLHALTKLQQFDTTAARPDLHASPRRLSDAHFPP